MRTEEANAGMKEYRGVAYLAKCIEKVHAELRKCLIVIRGKVC